MKLDLLEKLLLHPLYQVYLPKLQFVFVLHLLLVQVQFLPYYRFSVPYLIYEFQKKSHFGKKVTGAESIKVVYEEVKGFKSLRKRKKERDGNKV